MFPRWKRRRSSSSARKTCKQRKVEKILWWGRAMVLSTIQREREVFQSKKLWKEILMENIFAFAFETFRNLLRARKFSVFVFKAKQKFEINCVKITLLLISSSVSESDIFFRLNCPVWEIRHWMLKAVDIFDEHKVMRLKNLNCQLHF